MSILTTIDVLRGNAASALQGAQLEPPGSWQITRWLLRSRYRAIGPRPMLLCKANQRGCSGTAPFLQIATVYGLAQRPDKRLNGSTAPLPRATRVTQLLVTPSFSTYKMIRARAFCQKLKVPVPPTASPEAMSDKSSFFLSDHEHRGSDFLNSAFQTRRFFSALSPECPPKLNQIYVSNRACPLIDIVGYSKCYQTSSANPSRS